MRIPRLNSELKKISGLEYDTNGVPVLSPSNVMLVHKFVTEQSSYSFKSEDDFVKKYFHENTDSESLSTIITRVILIDTVDSTNLKQQLGKDYYKLMARKIIDSKIEEEISLGKCVNNKFEAIAKWPPKPNQKKDDRNLFIFVSKYVTRVNQFRYERNDYSIMDSVVKDNLPYYSCKCSNIEIPNLEAFRVNYQYDEFCDLIGKLLKTLPGISREMLDHFIWFVFKREAVGDAERK